MAVIKEDCQGISQKITMDVLREWLAGKGGGGVVGQSHSNSERLNRYK